MNKLYKRILNINYLPKILKILLVIGINWTFQSFLYMDKTEKIFKITVDLILLLLFYLIFIQLTNFVISVVLSFIIAHTLNWTFNGHIFALLKTFNIIKTQKEDFIKYINRLKERSSKEKSIYLVASLGSISRNELKETSDLDIRIIRKEGFLNGLKACKFIFVERSKSFLNGFPIDIYLGDNNNFLKKADEKSVIIFKYGENSEKLSKN